MKVFISHGHADAPLASHIGNELAKSGLDVWDADRELLPGDNPASETARALGESDPMVILLTSDAIAAPHVMREISFALGAKNFSHRLVPVAVGKSAE